MKSTPLNSRAGMTLVEMTFSLAIISLMFLVLAFLILAVGRNSYLVRDQSLSQNHSASASERITNLVRNASTILPYGADDMSTTQTRFMYVLPNGGAGGTPRTGLVAFVPPTNANSSDGVVKIFENQANYSPGNVATTKATYEFPNVQAFNVVFHSNSWITVGVSYSYRGFSLSTTDADNDGKIDSRLAGEFITDIIAKNHHPGGSAHYADTTSTIFLL